MSIIKIDAIEQAIDFLERAKTCIGYVSEINSLHSDKLDPIGENLQDYIIELQLLILNENDK